MTFWTICRQTRPVLGAEQGYLTSQCAHMQGLKSVLVLLFSHKHHFACDFTPNLIAFGDPLIFLPLKLEFWMYKALAVTCRRMSWRQVFCMCVWGKYTYTPVCILLLPLLIVKPINVSVEWDESAIVSSSINLTLSSLKERVNHSFPFNSYFYNVM